MGTYFLKRARTLVSRAVFRVLLLVGFKKVILGRGSSLCRCVEHAPV